MIQIGELRDCFVTTRPKASLCSSQRRPALKKFLHQNNFLSHYKKRHIIKRVTARSLAGKCACRRQSNLATAHFVSLPSRNLINPRLPTVGGPADRRWVQTNTRLKATQKNQQFSIIPPKTHYHRTFFCLFSCAFVTCIEVEENGAEKHILQFYTTSHPAQNCAAGEKKWEVFAQFWEAVGSKTSHKCIDNQ